jgi:hypothetical protein
MTRTTQVCLASLSAYFVRLMTKCVGQLPLSKAAREYILKFISCPFLTESPKPVGGCAMNASGNHAHMMIQMFVWIALKPFAAM